MESLGIRKPPLEMMIKRNACDKKWKNYNRNILI